jgi:hypothetical protein
MIILCRMVGRRSSRNPASAGGSRLVVDALVGRLSVTDNPFRPQRPMVERPLDIL